MNKVKWYIRGFRNGIELFNIEEIRKMGEFTEFDKFLNPQHPDYKDYKDRPWELAHDRGYNLAFKLRGLFKK